MIFISQNEWIQKNKIGEIFFLKKYGLNKECTIYFIKMRDLPAGKTIIHGIGCYDTF